MFESEIHLLRHKISNFLGFCVAENKVDFEIQHIFHETVYQRVLRGDILQWVESRANTR